MTSWTKSGQSRSYTDKRRERRQALSHVAAIASTEGALVTACAVRDISLSGARLEVEPGHEIPDEFVLLLSRNGRARRRCTVMWRSDTEIGVRFHPEPVADEAAD